MILAYNNITKYFVTKSLINSIPKHQKINKILKFDGLMYNFPS